MFPDFTPYLPYVLGIAFMAASALYASVGHGGASAYLAVMGLCGMAQQEMKPIALVLNIAVSTLALCHFVRAGHFRFGLFWPMAAASVPAAFLGGWLSSPEQVFKLVLAAALATGAWRLLAAPRDMSEETRPVSWPALVVMGGVIGFVSGLVGIGGGIFLTPLLILLRWAPAKIAAALSAAFITANSCSGLAGFMYKGGQIPAMVWVLLPTVLVGGWIGACWGSGKAPSIALRRSLAVVLAVAAAKFMIV
jgi:uncharacterized membrane protein YfcA